MTETDDAAPVKDQEKITPKIEDEIIELLDGDLNQTALEFAAYLKTNRLSPKQWFGPNYWRIPYGDCYLCGIVVNKARWRIWFFKGEYRGEFEDEFIKTVQENVRPCIACTNDCPKGIDTMVFGREFPAACFQFPIQFENPNSSTLEYIKDLIEYWKAVAPHSDSWHSH
jgi:hypothetical protein